VTDRYTPEFDINTIVPWGRSLHEYTRMFSLSDEDIAMRILDCGGGPASFNSELTASGGTVVSLDPIYAFPGEQIEQRVQETYPKIMEGVRNAYDRFVWTEISSPEHLGEIRMKAMRQFLADYPQGRSDRRYVPGALPTLPFNDNSFDLALVSHLLFLYSQELDEETHLASLLELLRVAKEARVFPLLGMDGEPSPHLPRVLGALRERGHKADLELVNYEFQRGGNQMAVIRR